MHLTPSAVSHGLGRLRRLLNDPLFLKTPKGVVPTARATELATPIAEVLARARRVISSAEPFDPARSTRRFAIGAPDGVSAVLLPSLFHRIRQDAPGIAISVRQLLPDPGEPSPERCLAIRVHGIGGARDGHRRSALRRRAGALPCADAVRGRFHSRGTGWSSSCRDADPGAILRSAAPRGIAIGGCLGLCRSFSRRARALATHCAHRAELHVRLGCPRRNGSWSPRCRGDSWRCTRSASAWSGSSRPSRWDRFQIKAVVPQVAMMDMGLAWLFEQLEHAVHAEAAAKENRGKPRRRSRR